MRVLGFNRVELIVSEDQIDAAVDQFNSVLGLRLPHPHAIEGQPVLSATDFEGGIELVAPVGGAGGFGARLAKHGPGQIGPLVFEIDDVDAARSWLESRGLRIRFEYDSSAGNSQEAASGVYQLVLDPDQWFGFSVTLMRRTGQARLSVFSARARGGDSTVRGYHEKTTEQMAAVRRVQQLTAVLDERQAMKELAGKVAVITGSASGIGLATLRALGREGMKVVMADVNETLLQEAAEGCLADGLTVHPVATDVSDFNAVRHLADVTYDTFGAVHVLHLNAGVASGANLLDEDTSPWHRIIDINLLGVVWGIKAFLPRMKQADQEAVILATSSGAGAEGTSFRSTAYAATKLAVVSVMESLYGLLREEQSPIRAGVVFPPLTATRLGGGDPANMKHVEQLLRSQGVPTVLMEPEQVAELILDGIKRDRFFIRVGAEENKRIFNGSLSQEYFDWNTRMIRGRAEAQLADGTPDEYLW